MWSLKLHYLLWFGSLSGIQPFVTIFAREHLKSSAESVGVLFFILPFVVSIVKPIVCSIADHYRQHSLILLICQWLMLFGYGLLLVIPVLVGLINANLLWWIFCIIVLLANTSNGPGVSLTDYLVINEVVRAKQQGNDGVNYGNFRIWGTIGYGLFGILSGFMNNFKDLPYLVPGLIMFVAIELLDIFCVFNFYHKKQNDSIQQRPEVVDSESVQPNETTSIAIWKDTQNNSRENSQGCWQRITHGLHSIAIIFAEVGRLFAYYPALIQLSFTVFCFGILTAFHWSYFFWFIQDLRGEDTILMGLCIFVESFLGEVPIFYIAHLIIQKFGAILSLCISLTAFAIRYIAYGYLLAEDKEHHRYWDILLVELLQGLTFSLFYTVMTHVAQYYADKCDKIEITYESDDSTQTTRRRKLKIKPSATMQGLLSACFEGIGLGTGSLIGGYIIEKYGTVRMVWKLGALISIVLIVLNLFIEFLKYFRNCCGNNKNELSMPNTNTTNTVST